MKTREFCIELEDKPGSLARVCSELGKGGINIKALTLDRIGNQVFLRVVPDDAKKTREVLGEDYMFSETDVLIKSLDDKPGALAKTAEKLSGKGVNIDAIYLLSSGKKSNVVFVLDNVDKGREVLNQED
jgi:hypothetical protein